MLASIIGRHILSNIGVSETFNQRKGLLFNPSAFVALSILFYFFFLNLMNNSTLL